MKDWAFDLIIKHLQEVLRDERPVRFDGVGVPPRDDGRHVAKSRGQRSNDHHPGQALLPAMLIGQKRQRLSQSGSTMGLGNGGIVLAVFHFAPFSTPVTIYQER